MKVDKHVIVKIEFDKKILSDYQYSRNGSRQARTFVLPSPWRTGGRSSSGGRLVVGGGVL
jgi:hypothetical protein